MQILTENPICFKTEKKLFFSEDRIDALFFHPEYVEIKDKIYSSIYPIFKFDDLIEFMTDGKHGGWNFTKEGVLFIRNSNVKEGEIDLSDAKYISSEDHNTVPRSHLKEGDVLFTTIGSVGESAVVDKKSEGANINQNLVRIVLKKEKILPKYFSIFLNSKFGRLQSQRQSTGNIQKIINYPAIKNFIISIPDKEIQKKIIDVNDDAKDKRNKLLAEINTLQKELYNYFLNTFGLSNFELNDEMVFTAYLEDRMDPYYYSPKFKRIANILKKCKFDLNKIGDLVEISNEKFDPKKEPYKLFKYIQIQDIDDQNNKISSFTSVLGKDAPDRARMLIKNGDILLPMLGGSLKSVAIVSEEYDGEIATNGFVILRVSEKNLRYFIFYYLTTIFAQLQIERSLTGAIMPSISKLDLKNILIPYQDLKIQKDMANKILETNSKISNLHEQSDKIIEVSKIKIEQMILGK